MSISLSTVVRSRIEAAFNAAASDGMVAPDAVRLIPSIPPRVWFLLPLHTNKEKLTLNFYLWFRLKM